MTSTSVDRLSGARSSLAIKAPCRVASTVNITTLNGLLTVDGVVTEADDRVLVKNQTSGVDNGIYVVDSGDWSLAPDCNGANDLAEGTIVSVTDGTVNGGTYWQVSTANPIVVGTTSITFAQALFSDSDLLSFLQSGTGTVERSAQDKMRERVSPEDYAPNTTPGTTNMQAAITSALGSLRKVETNSGIRRINTALAVDTSETLVGPGKGLSNIASYVTSGAAIATTAGAYSDYAHLEGLALYNLSTATTGFDLSTARHGVFRDLLVQDFTGTAFAFLMTTGAVGNYYNTIEDSLAYTCGKGYVYGRTGVGSNANRARNCKAWVCTTGLEVVNASGCDWDFTIVQATNAVVLTAGNNNRLRFYAEACTNIGSIAANFLDNEISYTNDGASVAITDATGAQNKIRSYPNPSPSMEYPGNQVDRIDWSWVGLTKSIYTVELQDEGTANVRIQVAGIVTTSGGGSESAELCITRVDAGTAVVTAARAAVRAGVGGAVTTTVSGGVVTIKISGDAVLTNKFTTKIDVEGVTTDGNGLMARVKLVRLPG